MAVPSVIVISSLNDQYGCSSFCPSAFIDGQLQSKYSESRLKCTLTRVATLISSAGMQSSVSVHDWYYMDGCAYIWYFFVCMSWLCLGSQSAMNSYGPGLYSISYVVLIDVLQYSLQSVC